MANSNSTRPSTAAAPGPDESTKVVFKLAHIISCLDAGRAAVFVAQSALDHGETDLELQCATSLQSAFETIDEAFDEVIALHNKLGAGVPDAQ